MERELLYARIDQRVDEMLEKGLVDEFQAALQATPDRSLNAWRTIGYQELIPWADGEYELEEAIRLIKRNSRRYAKRQLTWLRRNPELNWVKPDDLDRVKNVVSEITGYNKD